jgi:hypothetical protein
MQPVDLRKQPEAVIAERLIGGSQRSKGQERMVQMQAQVQSQVQ